MRLQASEEDNFTVFDTQDFLEIEYVTSISNKRHVLAICIFNIKIYHISFQNFQMFGLS
jgi:hypothetical protein